MPKSALHRNLVLQRLLTKPIPAEMRQSTYISSGAEIRVTLKPAGDVLLEIFVISYISPLKQHCMLSVLSEISSQSIPKLGKNLSLSLTLKYVDKLVPKLNQQF